jgi:hypothetical protein
VCTSATVRAGNARAGNLHSWPSEAFVVDRVATCCWSAAGPRVVNALQLSLASQVAA